jgi:hypothetical protein
MSEVRRLTTFTASYLKDGYYVKTDTSVSVCGPCSHKDAEEIARQLNAVLVGYRFRARTTATEEKNDNAE